jgi:hypothetical protein
MRREIFLGVIASLAVSACGSDFITEDETQSEGVDVAYVASEESAD